MLDPEIVNHAALLARLALTDAEKQKMREQLSQILEHFRALSDLDTSDIPPTAQVIPLENTMREDEVRPSMPRDEVLANAPRVDGDFIRVPAVLKEF